MFAHFGLTGPIVLTAVTDWPLAEGSASSLRAFIDLKPALSEEQLDQRLLRDFEQFPASSSRIPRQAAAQEPDSHSGLPCLGSILKNSAIRLPERKGLGCGFELAPDYLQNPSHRGSHCHCWRGGCERGEPAHHGIQEGAGLVLLRRGFGCAWGDRRFQFTGSVFNWLLCCP